MKNARLAVNGEFNGHIVHPVRRIAAAHDGLGGVGQAPERSIGRTQACEEHHVCSALCLTDVPAPGVAVEATSQTGSPNG